MLAGHIPHPEKLRSEDQFVEQECGGLSAPRGQGFQRYEEPDASIPGQDTATLPKLPCGGVVGFEGRSLPSMRPTYILPPDRRMRPATYILPPVRRMRPALALARMVLLVCEYCNNRYVKSVVFYLRVNEALVEVVDSYHDRISE